MPRCFRMILSAVSSLVLVSCGLSAQAQPGSATAYKSLVTAWEPIQQEQFAPYWTLEPGWTTELEIRNNIPWRDLTVTPVLRTTAGAEVALAPVTLKPNEITSVDLHQALATVGPELVGTVGSFGSAVLRFDGIAPSNAFGAALVRREGAPIDFHFDTDFEGSSALEGVWWLPTSAATDYLILSNPTSKPVNASLVISDNSGGAQRLPLTIGPAQTERLSIRDIVHAPGSGAIGGLSLAVAGGGVLSASEIVFDETTGFSAIMKIFDREAGEKVSTHVLRAPMMALSQPDPSLALPQGTRLVPRIILRNAASGSMAVSAVANWRSQTSSGTFRLPPIVLAHGQVSIVNMQDFQKSGQIPTDATWATVTLAYTGTSADLVAVALSYDQNSLHGLQTPFSEGTNRLLKGSMWHVDAHPQHAHHHGQWWRGADAHTGHALLQRWEE